MKWPVLAIVVNIYINYNDSIKIVPRWGFMNKKSEMKPKGSSEVAPSGESSAAACTSAEVVGGKVSRSLKEVHKGKRATIIHCEDALNSFHEVMAQKSLEESKARSLENNLAMLVERLGDGLQMSGESFPFEGKLPDGNKFRAFKKIPIRAYLWLSKRRKNVYYISHYKFKSEDDLDQKDTDRICRNWTRIEVNDDER